MKIKTIAGIFVLLVSCTALASDSPFEKGKTYLVFYGRSNPHFVEIKDVKDKWILVNDTNQFENYCKNVNSSECWLNTDILEFASPAH